MPLKLNPFQQFPVGSPPMSAAPDPAAPTRPADIRPTGSGPSEGGRWEIRLHPADTLAPAGRAALLEKLRPALEKKLQQTPDVRDMTLNTLLGTVQVCLREGHSGPGVPMQFTFAPDQRALSAARHSAASLPETGASPLTVLHFPDESTHALGQRLVGLDAARADVLLQWSLQWDGALETWSRRTGQPVPPALQDHLREAHGLLIFSGDAGTGKSALARVISDAYCREQGITGAALFVTTAARGTGLVGQFSQRLREAFQQLLSLPEGSLRVLILDEADSLSVRRSEAQAHQEDRAATASLLQSLDAIAGLPRTAVIATTNLLDSLDPALLRRAHVVRFERPGQAARERLLTPWLPSAAPKEIAKIALAADGLTPADLDKTMLGLWKGVIGSADALTVAGVIAALRATPRTQSV